MLLATLQDHLSCLYEAPIEHRVADYLVTDARLAQALEASDHEQTNGERLLVRECDDALDISLYIDAQILSKGEEEALLYNDMQNDIVQQILRRVAAAKAHSG